MPRFGTTIGSAGWQRKIREKEFHERSAPRSSLFGWPSAAGVRRITAERCYDFGCEFSARAAGHSTAVMAAIGGGRSASAPARTRSR